jgi:hypothetical protein
VTDEKAFLYLKNIYREYVYLFRDNLFKMGYTEMFLRKSSYKFDRELFTSKKI